MPISDIEYNISFRDYPRNLAGQWMIGNLQISNNAVELMVITNMCCTTLVGHAILRYADRYISFFPYNGAKVYCPSYPGVFKAPTIDKEYFTNDQADSHYRFRIYTISYPNIEAQTLQRPLDTYFSNEFTRDGQNQDHVPLVIPRNEKAFNGDRWEVPLTTQVTEAAEQETPLPAQGAEQSNRPLTQGATEQVDMPLTQEPAEQVKPPDVAGYFAYTTCFADCLLDKKFGRYLAKCFVKETYNCTTIINYALGKMDKNLVNDLSFHQSRRRFFFDFLTIVSMVINCVLGFKINDNPKENTRFVIITVETVILGIAMSIYTVSAFNAFELCPTKFDFLASIYCEKRRKYLLNRVTRHSFLTFIIALTTCILNIGGYYGSDFDITSKESNFKKKIGNFFPYIQILATIAVVSPNASAIWQGIMSPRAYKAVLDRIAVPAEELTAQEPNNVTLTANSTQDLENSIVSNQINGGL